MNLNVGVISYPIGKIPFSLKFHVSIIVLTCENNSQIIEDLQS